MRRFLPLLLVLALLAAGCGNATKTVTDTGPNGQTTVRTVPKVHFAKTKFLLHAGLAFGAFHRYIYKPFRSGAFRSGAPKRVRTLLKAAAAGAFSLHEIKQARRSALASDVLRRRVVTPLDRFTGKLAALPAALKSGHFSPSQIIGAEGALGSLRSISSGAGAAIKDRNAPVPGG